MDKATSPASRVPAPHELFNLGGVEISVDRLEARRRAINERAGIREDDPREAYVSVYHGKRVQPPPWAVKAEAEARRTFEANEHLYASDLIDDLRSVRIYQIAW